MPCAAAAFWDAAALLVFLLAACETGPTSIGLRRPLPSSVIPLCARPVGQLRLRVKNMGIQWWMGKMRLTEGLERGFPVPSKIGGRTRSLHLNRKVT